MLKLKCNHINLPWNVGFRNESYLMVNEESVLYLGYFIFI